MDGMIDLPKQRGIIVAGNARQARSCARILNINPLDYVYVSDVLKLHGYRRPSVYLYGNFHVHPYWEEIRRQLKIIEARCELVDVTGSIKPWR